MHGFNVVFEVIGVIDGIIEVMMKHLEDFLLGSFAVEDFFRWDAFFEHVKGLTKRGIDLPELGTVKWDVFSEKIGGGAGPALFSFFDSFWVLLGFIDGVDTGAKDLEKVFFVGIHAKLEWWKNNR